MLSLGLSSASAVIVLPGRLLGSSFRRPSFLPRFSRSLLCESRVRNISRAASSQSSLPPLSPATAGRTRYRMDEIDSRPKLCTKMRLWELPEHYIVEPTDGTHDYFLSISRLDGSLNLIGELPEAKAPKVTIIYGLMGILKLIGGACLVVITERECVGSYLGHPIFRVSSLKILPCDHYMKALSAEQRKTETEFFALLNAVERIPGLYFSYDVNLTLCAQKLYDLGEESRLAPLWRQADSRFLWNNFMLQVLIDSKVEPYLLPVIQGSFQTIQALVGKDTVDVTLIARRCIRRTGTRMWRRGADMDGYVANFVESEQIMQSNGHTASFVQVRGSIPVLWEQIVDLTYKPKFEIVKPEEAPQVTERHFLDLRRRYGSILAVDLVNGHGSEGLLSEKYASAMQKILSDDIRYLHFDFHRICGHVDFDHLSILYNQIEDYLNNQGYFLLKRSEKVMEQLGVLRTNCIDCLDRTNVTQSMVGRKMLEKQLQAIGIFHENEAISAHSNFDESFKILWANHGDSVSLQYSGTPALKRDLVRYGKQTWPGILADGWNALSRYYLNNFCDGTKQDAIDLLLGHYIVPASRDMKSPPQIGSSSVLNSLPVATALIMTGLVFAKISSKKAQSDSRYLLLSAVFSGLSLSIAAYVRANGRKFCNRPRLNKTRD